MNGENFRIILELRAPGPEYLSTDRIEEYFEGVGDLGEVIIKDIERAEIGDMEHAEYRLKRVHTEIEKITDAIFDYESSEGTNFTPVCEKLAEIQRDTLRQIDELINICRGDK